MKGGDKKESLVFIDDDCVGLGHGAPMG
jgi:hypothetical protein